jgi:hypothetical protein
MLILPAKVYDHNDARKEWHQELRKLRYVLFGAKTANPFAAENTLIE